MAALGVVFEDGPPADDREPLALWTCHLDAWDLFGRVQTQWRTSMGGSEGLDYNAVEVVMARRKVPEDRRDRLFADLQVIEQAALEAWSERK